MTGSEIQALVERFEKAWTGKDLDGLLACYDEQAELVSPLLHTVRGLAAIEGAHQTLFVAFKDVASDIHDIVVDVEHQRAVLVFTIHATQDGEFLGFPSDHRRTATPSAFVFHLKDGRIVSERRIYDFAGFLMQLGILKAKGV